MATAITHNLEAAALVSDSNSNSDTVVSSCRVLVTSDSNSTSDSVVSGSRVLLVTAVTVVPTDSSDVDRARPHSSPQPQSPTSPQARNPLQNNWHVMTVWG